GHVSPEAAAGGDIALLKTGDLITIDITSRSINVLLSDTELLERQAREAEREEAYKPLDRKREVPVSLKAYAATVSSADKGAVRII
ncbi:MAG: dihydroxy-acid dehydratase, partial [Bacteroidales bacterium]|nr:dihydroxy-acid dehydratase [Bacteroidales bacterium]